MYSPSGEGASCLFQDGSLCEKEHEICQIRKKSLVMQITYYRHKKGVLRMHSRDMEYIVGLLKNGKDAEAILSVRRKLNMAFLARTTDLSGKLPVLAFGSTFKKNGDGIQLRRYNGYVLLEVNGLESQSEAEAVRREAAALPQTLLAFVGLSGRSVKIVVPFVLPDGSLPKKEEQARMFHAAAYQLAVRHYQPQLGEHYIVERTVPVAGVPDECGSGRLLQSGCGGDPDRATFADAGRG